MDRSRSADHNIRRGSTHTKRALDKVHSWPHKRPSSRRRQHATDIDENTSVEITPYNDYAQNVFIGSKQRASDDSFIAPSPNVRRSTNLNAQDSELQRRHRFKSITRTSILRAQQFWNGSGSFGVDFVYKLSNTLLSDKDIRWIHCQSYGKILKEFQHLLSRLPELTKSEVVLVSSILRRVEKHHQQDLASGANLEPLIAQSQTKFVEEDGKRTPRWILFVNMPYLAIYPNHVNSAVDQSSIIPQRLLQYRYPLEQMERPDIHQALHSENKLSAKESLCVSSMWAVLTSSGTLITASPDAFESLHQSHLRGSQVQTVRIAIPTEDGFFHSIRDCETYSDLHWSAAAAWKKVHASEPQNYSLNKKDGTVVTADNWQLDHDSRSGFIDVTVSGAETRIPAQQDQARFIKKTYSNTDGATISHVSRSNIAEDLDITTNLKCYNEATSSNVEHEEASVPSRNRLDIDKVNSILVNTSGDKRQESNRKGKPSLRFDESDERYSMKENMSQRLSSLDDIASSNGEQLVLPRSGGSVLQTQPQASYLESLNSVPAFFLWLDRNVVSGKDGSDSSQQDGSRSIHIDMVANAEKPEGSQLQMPAHLVKVVNDIEQSILRGKDDTKSPLSFNHTIAIFYDKLNPLNQEGLNNEVQKWLATYTGDIDGSLEAIDSWQNLLSNILRKWQAIADQFCPQISQNLFMEKLATSRGLFMQQIQLLCEPQQQWSIIDTSTQEETEKATCYIFDVSSTPDSFAKAQPRTRLSFQGCDTCESFISKSLLGHPFSSRTSAKTHLRESHFRRQKISHEDLARYIIPETYIYRFHACASAIELMTTLLKNLTEVEKLVDEIKQNVIARGTFQETTYRLTTSFIEAYQHFVSNVLFSLHIATRAVERFQKRTAPAMWPQALIAPEQINAVAVHGLETMNSLSQAKIDVMMNQTGDVSNAVSFEKVGLGYMLIVVVRDLCERLTSLNNVGIMQMYTYGVTRLDYKVKHRPRRRFRNDIIRFREEISTLGVVFDTQMNALVDLVKALDPETVGDSSNERRSEYELELDAVEYFAKSLAARKQHADSLLVKLRFLEDELVRGIEIKQDDHGKAILVFTTITIIYMPLSFATSFLGMNTVGIRDLNSGQWLFWAIALPLTIATIALALVVGYHSEQIRDTIMDMLQSVTFTDRAWLAGLKSRSHHVSMEDNASAGSGSPMFPILEPGNALESSSRGATKSFWGFRRRHVQSTDHQDA